MLEDEKLGLNGESEQVASSTQVSAESASHPPAWSQGSNSSKREGGSQCLSDNRSLPGTLSHGNKPPVCHVAGHPGFSAGGWRSPLSSVPPLTTEVPHQGLAAMCY